jgi:hypothetical protein
MWIFFKVFPLSFNSFRLILGCFRLSMQLLEDLELFVILAGYSKVLYLLLLVLQSNLKLLSFECDVSLHDSL